MRRNLSRSYAWLRPAVLRNPPGRQERTLRCLESKKNPANVVELEKPMNLRRGKRRKAMDRSAGTYPGWYLHGRRELLNAIWGDSTHPSRRMRWWSNVDQQERSPGDMSLSRKALCACPAYIWRTSNRFLHPSGRQPIWAPWSVIREIFAGWWKQPIQIHPEWRLAWDHGTGVAPIRAAWSIWGMLKKALGLEAYQS